MPLLEFTLAALIVLVLPGPGVIYVVTRSLLHGTPSGLASVLGLATGALLQSVAVAFGLSAILLASAAAFGIVKLLGVAYLMYLGIRVLRSGTPPDGTPPDGTPPGSAPPDEPRRPAALSMRRVFAEGLLVSLLNPKSALFFIAFLPQFVVPEAGSVTAQLLLLGLLYAALALITDGAYALCASRIGGLVEGRLARSALPRYAEASLYFGLGVTLLAAERKP